MRAKVQVGLASFQFMINGRRAIFYTFLTLFMAEALGANFIEIGLVITLPMLANSTMQALVWGRVSDRIKRRRLLVLIGETSAGIGYLLLWTSISIWTIILGLTLIEAIWSMSNTGWSALFADLTKPHERSTLMGRITTLGVVGRLLGITAVGLIYDYPSPGAGFPLVFPIAAAIMFTSVIVLGFLVPEISTSSEQETRDIKSNSDFPIKKIFTRQTHRFFIFLGTWAIITIGWACYMSLFTVYLRGGLYLTSPEISLVMNLNSGVGLAAAPIAGYLGDRIGRKPVIIGALLIQAATTVLYGFSTTLPLMLVIATLNGIPRQMFFTVGYALAADLIPEELRGRLFGTYNAVWTLAFGSSPTVVGGVFASWRQSSYLAGGFPLIPATLQAIVDTFYLSGGIVLSGAIIFGLLVRETRPKSHILNDSSKNI